MQPPHFFKNPFVTHTALYKTFDIYERINMNMLYVVPFNRIFIRTEPHVKKVRIVEADYRYPAVLYKSKLDPLNTTVTKEFCIFDGTHRIHKMISEGKTSSVFFVIGPEIFDGLKSDRNFDEQRNRSTGCLGCME